MSKFYVESGSMMEIVDAADPEEGVRKAVHRYLDSSTEEISFGNLIFIGEQGFAEKHDCQLVERYGLLYCPHW